jgi:hypothetical protein
MNMDNFYGKDVPEVKSTTTSTFRYNDDALVDAKTINAYIEELEEIQKENENIKSSCADLIEAGNITLKQRDDLMKALKSLVCVAEKDEINKKHLDVTLRKARNIIADIDPTIERCDCCY